MNISEIIKLDRINYTVVTCTVRTDDFGPHSKSSNKIFKTDGGRILYIPCTKHVVNYERAVKRNDGWEEVSNSMTDEFKLAVVELLLDGKKLEYGIPCPHGGVEGYPLTHDKSSGRVFKSQIGPGYIIPCESHLEYFIKHNKEVTKASELQR